MAAKSDPGAKPGLNLSLNVYNAESKVMPPKPTKKGTGFRPSAGYTVGIHDARRPCRSGRSPRAPHADRSQGLTPWATLEIHLGVSVLYPPVGATTVLPRLLPRPTQRRKGGRNAGGAGGLSQFRHLIRSVKQKHGFRPN